MSQRGKMAQFAQSRPISIESAQNNHGNHGLGTTQLINKDSIWDSFTDDVSDITATPISRDRVVEIPTSFSPPPFISGLQNNPPETYLETTVGRMDGALSRGANIVQNDRMRPTSNHPGGGSYPENSQNRRYQTDQPSNIPNNGPTPTSTSRFPRFGNFNLPPSPTDAQIDRWKAVVNQTSDDRLDRAFGGNLVYTETSDPSNLNRHSNTRPTGNNGTRDEAGHVSDYKSLYLDVNDTMPLPNTVHSARPPQQFQEPIVHPVTPPKTVPQYKGDGDFLDYDPVTLKGMSYAALQKVPFDEDPSALSAIGHEPGFTPTIPVSSPLPDRLSSILYAPQAQQSYMLESLPFAEWEDAGDWIIEQMGNVMKRLSAVRKDKRRLMVELEDEVFKWHELVEVKRERIDDALGGMRKNGGAILRDSLSPSKP